MRRAIGRVLSGRAHRELVHVGLPEDGQAGLLAAGGHRRVEDRDVALENARTGGGRDALRCDEILVRDRNAVARFPDDVEVGVQLAVALLDRVEVSTRQLLARGLLALEETGGVLRGQAQRVDHSHVPGGRRGPPSASSVSRKTARVAREQQKKSTSLTSPPPERERPRRPHLARWPTRTSRRSAARRLSRAKVGTATAPTGT